MKKIIILFVIVVLFFILTGCTVSELTIKEDLKKHCEIQNIEFFPNDIEIKETLIINNDTIFFLCKINSGPCCICYYNIVIENINIEYQDFQMPFIWYKGKVLELEEAYSEKIISIEDVKNIKSILENN